MSDSSLDIIYDDEHLFVVNKPSGVLSQPGKQFDGSIATQAKLHFPEATGSMLVHRLDMDTSGVLLLAKSPEVHRALQQQFEKRQTYKRYVALLEGAPSALGGTVSLPLRVDLENRPHQIVCFEHGRHAQTLWRKLDNPIQQHPVHTRVQFFPVTGRSHQLRVHAAHSLGLGCAIVGDRLYGQVGERLMLHAELLAFTHPVTKQWLSIEAPVPF